MPGLKLAGGFLAIILIGTFLLSLPISHKEGVDVSVLDAAFVSTSAVCVTGLTPIDIQTSLSLFGSTVLMLLIQAGGLGYAVLAVIFIRLSARGLELSDRSLLRDSLGADPRIGTKKLFNTALGVTFTAEGIGAILLFSAFVREYPVPRAIYLGIFHSVSAFNNAGFDLFTTSLIGWNDSYLVLVTIALLIISGGLGFIFYQDVLSNLGRKRLSLHVKVVASMTLFLIVAGTLLFALLMPGLDLKNAFFQSVTTRTAGFFSFDQFELPSSAVLLSIFLMFVGASPGSTGGGVKTTSAFAAIFGSFSLLLGRKPQAFKRTIDSESVNKAFFLIIISVLFISATFFLLTITEPGADPLNLLFETVSAYATVGLTIGVTPTLSIPGKLLIMLAMFCGRVGLMTIITAFARRGRGEASYIEEKVAIG